MPTAGKVFGQSVERIEPVGLRFERRTERSDRFVVLALAEEAEEREKAVGAA